MKLYYHPLSTYSQKALIALYEKSIEFTPKIVYLFDEHSRAEYLKVYPMGKIPVLIRDDDWMIPESSIIIEYLDGAFESGPRLIPEDEDKARQVRFMDRMHDLYLNNPVATSLFETWKPQEARDTRMMAKNQGTVQTMYQYMDRSLEDKDWIMGEFSMADCAAAPPLFYAQQVIPFDGYANVKAYFNRLRERPSYQRVLSEAQPYLERLQADTA